jgi:hypothetical protein
LATLVDAAIEVVGTVLMVAMASTASMVHLQVAVHSLVKAEEPTAVTAKGKKQAPKD